MSEQKTYVKCKAKRRQFSNGGEVINVSFKATDLIAFARQHANQAGYLNLVVAERREPGQYGDTHTVYLDTFVPRTPSGKPANPDTMASASPFGSDDDPGF